MKNFTILVILLIVLSGCSDGNRYNFTDSTENWDVFYDVDVSAGDEQRTTGTIKYIGKEPAPKTIDYKIEYATGVAEGMGKSLTDGSVSTGNDACTGCSVIQEDDEIAVEITWDGQKEKLVLTTGK
ncbi:hypothetical protein [Planococcus sp. S3-L1]|uniref:hypothetical protein n=1 Tax=Planococcus sp. S3-L1 TaxID=3046200 RepID=UPI0024BA844E|nr:hypothetical protein [Planococcus sp. S3-L1]MDJ0333026.1 hypothetical protein [Planococcus sp. S3-L1]